MRARALLQLTRQNLRRNRVSLGLSSVGIVVGAAVLLFFLALGAGVKTVVLERIFVVDHLEVVPRSYDVGFLKVGGVAGLTRKLDDDAVARLRGLDGVAAVYPKLRFAFKAMAWTAQEFLGRSFHFEIFGDGIDPELVPELTQGLPGARFEDRSACSESKACDPGLTCQEGRCLGPACRAGEEPSPCPPTTWCLPDTGFCEPDIPVLVSPHLLELYNGSVARAFGFPRISQDTFVGVYGTMRLGRSFAGRDAGGPVRERRLRVVGVSPKAITFGATLPISYVRRFNSWYRKEEGGYDSVVVQVARNEQVPQVVSRIEDRDGGAGLGFDLAPRSRQALQAGLMISVLTLVFSLISLVIVALAAISIAHTFFMILSERRAEIGLLRALGAGRADARNLVLAESAVVGLLGGTLGCLGGLAATVLVDRVSAAVLPDFPYKPESYFAYAPEHFAIVMAVAVGFCLLGAWWPARRAARLDPARALTGR